MKKVIIFLFACFALSFCFGSQGSSAKDIENVSTVIGNYCYDGFVPYSTSVFNGDLVVSDRNNHRLSVVDLSTSKVSSTLGSYGSGKDKFKYPGTIISHGKDLLVCDMGNNRIAVYKDGLAFSYEIALKKAPVDMAVVGDNVYILYEDGVLIDVYNLVSKTFKEQIKVSAKATNISSFKNSLILLGEKTYIYGLDTQEYLESPQLKGCISFYEHEDKGYALFSDEYIILDKDMNTKETFGVHDGTSIYAGKNGVFICDPNKGTVNLHKGDRAISSFGKERPLKDMKYVTARGSLVAVSNGQDIHFYKNGKLVFELTNDNVVDIKIVNDNLYVLKPHSICSYKISRHGDGDVSVVLEKTLDANGSYSFTAMDCDGNNIYITEKNSGKVLKVDVGLKVFSTVVSGVKSPQAIACGDGRLYIGDENGINVYTTSGDKLKEEQGKYISLTYNKRLYGIISGAKKVKRFDKDLNPLSDVAYDGYFVNLGDIEAREYGLLACDYDRDEVMVHTVENLELSNNNLTVNSKKFDGKVVKGQTVTVKVSGAGMMNHLPEIGDVRYYPASCGIDSQIPLNEDKGRFYASISMQNVGNYTLKVVYKKQMFIGGTWQDVKTADSVLTYDLPVAVTPEHVATQEDTEIIYDYFLELKKFFCGF